MRKNQAIYRQVGPPSIKQVRQIATRLYLLTLREHYGWISLGKLQKVLLKEADQSNLKYWLQNSRRFYKNMRGSVIRDRKLIDHIEERVPGSRRLFDHPLWLILEHPDACLEELHTMMQQLHPDLEKRLFKVDERSAIRIRKAVRNKHEMHRIAIRGDLDALACFLMLVREMEILKRIDPYIEAKWHVQYLISLLTLHKPFFYISESLYEIAYEYFIKHNESLTKKSPAALLKAFPEYFKAPDKFHSLYRQMDINVTIVSYAKLHNVLGNSIKDQMHFLYIATLMGSRTDIEEQLKKLPSKFIYNGKLETLPNPIREIMRYMSDKRLAITAGTFFD